MNLRLVLVAALVATLVIAPAAAAHVTLNPREWEAGGFARFAVRVPTERDNASTTKIVMKFPEQILSASFQPVEGWQRSVKMVQLDEPIDVEGEEVTERIDTVTWTGGRVRPGEFQEFGVSFRTPEEPGTELAFPTVQTYSNGEVVRWIGPADADSPAPIVAITEAPAEEAEAPAPAETPAEESGGSAAAEEDSGTDTLSIVALIVGVVGLGVGLVALFGRRQRVAA